VNRFSKKEDYILLLEDPINYVLLDRKHAFEWGVMLDENIRFYDGVTVQEKLNQTKETIEKKLPKVIYAPDTSQFWPQRQRHSNAIVFPIIRAHGYSDFGGGIYVLNKTVVTKENPK
jgi:hypothetical protein